MTCVKMGNAIVCLVDAFEYEGFLFEVHSYLGPSLLKRKDHNPWDRTIGPKNKFWPVFEKWNGLSNEEKEKTRLY